ncbi:hypothetical protein HNR60_002280 [Rhodopseudomonas rhenobacensis]|uniref:Uncharacterized protein n=1 Tax=Rhodopseudomonas rhenobacensis TaxID=87461 RepID=A0A7W8DZ12_9BRAD|nr:hypothetical protein [Rhodopseudomonas rhenobacensis]MBB5047523.1 hypothetical protein [Rhodopseudomonas rhenobacensis]
MLDDTHQPPHVPAPELFTIPTALVEQWNEIPQTERVVIPLTRQDVDHLLLGLLRALESQSTLERVMIDWSNGRLDAANQSLAEFRRQNADAQNNIRQLAAALMASALRERKHG